MGLLNVVRAGAAVAFGALGDLKTSATYRSIPPGEYDPVKGAPYDLYSGPQSVSIEVVESDVKKSDPLPFKSNALPEGAELKKFLVLQTAMGTVKPKLRDELLLASGKVYIVQGAAQDTAGATWTIFGGRIP